MTVPRHPGIDQRRVDVLALPGSPSIQQCGQNRGRREERRTKIGDRHADLHWPSRTFPGDGHQPRHALRDEIEATLRRIRSGLAVAGYRRVDEPSLIDGQRLATMLQMIGLDLTPFKS